MTCNNFYSKKYDIDFDEFPINVLTILKPHKTTIEYMGLRVLKYP